MPLTPSTRRTRTEEGYQFQPGCEALCAITHARDFLGTIPGIFLMTMLPSFGKSRFEIAFVYQKFDGSYQEREARNAIVPRDRWIDSLTSKAAFRALRPNGKSFYNNDNMELYVRCVTPVKNTWEEPSYDLPNASKPRDQDHEDESTAAPIHRAGQEDLSVQEEGRHIHVPFHLWNSDREDPAARSQARTN